MEKVIAFGKIVMGDEKLRNELLTAVQGKSADDAAQAAAAFATSHGYEATPAEVKEGYKAYLNMNKPGADGALSDAQLAAVSGGSKGGDIATGMAGAAIDAQTGGPSLFSTVYDHDKDKYSWK